MKGAVEEILKFCSTAFVNGKNEPITILQDLQFQEQFERAMINGKRIIGTQSCFMCFLKYFNCFLLESLEQKLGIKQERKIMR